MTGSRSAQNAADIVGLLAEEEAKHGQPSQTLGLSFAETLIAAEFMHREAKTLT